MTSSGILLQLIIFIGIVVIVVVVGFVVVVVEIEYNSSFVFIVAATIRTGGAVVNATSLIVWAESHGWLVDWFVWFVVVGSLVGGLTDWLVAFRSVLFFFIIYVVSLSFDL